MEDKVAYTCLDSPELHVENSQYFQLIAVREYALAHTIVLEKLNSSLPGIEQDVYLCSYRGDNVSKASAVFTYPLWLLKQWKQITRLIACRNSLLAWTDMW